MIFGNCQEGNKIFINQYETLQSIAKVVVKVKEKTYV